MKENKLTCKLLRKYTVYYYVSLSDKEPNEIHPSIHQSINPSISLLARLQMKEMII